LSYVPRVGGGRPDNRTGYLNVDFMIATAGGFGRNLTMFPHRIILYRLIDQGHGLDGNTRTGSSFNGWSRGRWAVPQRQSPAVRRGGLALSSPTIRIEQ